MSNPRLCDNSDTRFSLQGNAPAAQCGCTDPLALNVMNMASNVTYYDDGTCEGATCSNCITGSTGTCAFPLSNGDSLCMAAVNGTCPVLANGSQTQACDLCAGVVCNEPPSCYNAASGVCSSTSGLCMYSTWLPAGTGCNDGNPTTGRPLHSPCRPPVCPLFHLLLVLYLFH